MNLSSEEGDGEVEGDVDILLLELRGVADWNLEWCYFSEWCYWLYYSIRLMYGTLKCIVLSWFDLIVKKVRPDYIKQFVISDKLMLRICCH